MLFRKVLATAFLCCAIPNASSAQSEDFNLQIENKFLMNHIEPGNIILDNPMRVVEKKEYSFDLQENDWKEEVKFAWEYEGNSKSINTKFLQTENGEWQTISRTVKEVTKDPPTNEKVTVTINEVYSYGAFVRVSVRTVRTKEDGSLTLDSLKVYEDQFVKLSELRKTEYDELLRAVSFLLSVDDGTELVPKEKKEWEYTEEKEVQTQSIYRDQNWENANRTITVKDSSKAVKQVIDERWDNNTWLGFMIQEYLRSATGQIMAIMFTFWNSQTNDWNTFSNRTLFEYWNGGFAFIGQYHNGNEFVDVSRTEYYKDSYGNTIEYITKTKADSVWQNNKRETYNYESLATDVSEEIIIPKTIDLSAFPNPFNPEVKIVYTISEPQNIRLEVYNSLGQQVGVIADKYSVAGTFMLNWNASNLSSGNFFVRLVTSNASHTIKIMLIK